ncbi:single-stranded DNA-binding protein [Deinococcus lacus]|uniref:Single-stranded DNA-binding protein n=1 Tax=Deinococcus lacus TaxID=392561 RepID=A0ABW1YC23_9DEIO
MADLDRAREALRASMTAWATLEVRGDQASVIPVPQLDALVLRLDAVDPEWSLHWRCDSAEPPVVCARLGLLGRQREGLATGHTLSDARAAALAEAVRLYGVHSVGEARWVEYDPEDGPNTADLEAELELEVTDAAPAISAPPEPPRDPQMDKARRYIDDMLEQLRAAGRGKEAAQAIMRGYGDTLEESRAIYKQLQELLKGPAGS